MSRVQIQEKNGQTFALDLTLDAETVAAMLAPWSQGASGIAPDLEWLAITANAERTQARARNPFLSAVAARFRGHPKCRLNTECTGGTWNTQLAGVMAVLTGADGLICVRVGVPVPYGPMLCVPVDLWELETCEFPTKEPTARRAMPADVDELFRAIDDILACGIPPGPETNWELYGDVYAYPHP